MSARVSVVTIFHDEERFLAEAIESVRAQSHGDWELLLVDDGSTDGSAEVAHRYATKEPDRIRCLHHPDRARHGMSASRNVGLAAARGAYVAFLDADDVWVPEKLAEQLALLERHPTAGLVHGPVEWWYSWTGDPADRARDHAERLDVIPDRLHPARVLLPALLREEHPTMTPALVRRSILDRVGGFEERFGGLYEDQVAYVKVTLEAPAFASSRCWYRWRKHARSSCELAVGRDEYEVARRRFLAWMRRYLMRRGMRDAGIWTALRDERARLRRRRVARAIDASRTRAVAVTMPLRRAVRPAVPLGVRHWLRARRYGREYVPPVGEVVFGGLRRVTPIGRKWGYDRGVPVDRHYIEAFFERHAGFVRGRVLEIGDDRYTRRFGGDRVSRSDVLHVSGGAGVTIVADLTADPPIPSSTFDCIICTQTLQFVYDVRAAVRTLHRILKPGGTLLASVGGVAHQVSRDDMDQWGDYWRFTTRSARRLFEEVFPPAAVGVAGYGNVLVALAFQHGLATEDLQPRELEHHDPDYDVTITIFARKPEESS